MLLLSSDLRWQWTTTRLNSFDNLMFDVWQAVEKNGSDINKSMKQNEQ